MTDKATAKAFIEELAAVCKKYNTRLLYRQRNYGQPTLPQIESHGDVQLLRIQLWQDGKYRYGDFDYHVEEGQA